MPNALTLRIGDRRAESCGGAGRRLVGGRRFGSFLTDAMGSGAEAAFAAACAREGARALRANAVEERRLHYDFIVTPSPHPCVPRGRPCRVEVKSVKCPVRGGAPDPTLVYVELLSVGGHPGWVHGAADVVAFQQGPRSFLLVDRRALQDLSAVLQCRFPMAPRSGFKDTLWARRERQDLVLVLDRDTLLAALPPRAILFWPPLPSLLGPHPAAVQRRVKR